MKNLKMCLINLLLILSSCSFVNKDKIDTQKNKKEDENQVIQEFCSLDISHFDTLLKNMIYIFHRSGGYVFDYKNENRYRFLIIKSNANFQYRELDPIQDSLFYDLDDKQKYFEQRYLIEIQRVKEVVIFCDKLKISEIKINKRKHNYSFYLSIGNIYYRESEPLSYDEKICENWYFLRKIEN
jgi:hypothetical protein